VVVLELEEVSVEAKLGLITELVEEVVGYRLMKNTAATTSIRIRMIAIMTLVPRFKYQYTNYVFLDFGRQR
jgi:hypothetical protein